MPPAHPVADVVAANAVLAGVGLGANLGQPAQQVQAALNALASLPHTRRVAASKLYRSAPLGPAGQPDYCNAVALLATTLSAEALLDALLALETQLGRIRPGAHWGARHIDLDLLFHGNHQCQTATLTLPHPQLAVRNFVLIPLAELAPGLSLPNLGPMASLAARLSHNDLTVWA